jgi:type IV pilus modification protein PilV
MASHPRDPGFTLIEVVIAMAVLTIGSLGLLSVTRAGLQLNADARVTTRATALAQDLIAQMQTWDYANDARLQDSNTGNNDNWDDHEGAFEGAVTSGMYDHTEADLGGAAWLGVPTATVQALGFTRYWNVEEDPADVDANGALMGRRVAVIVRWVHNGAGRRIVLVTFIRDPQVTN